MADPALPQGSDVPPLVDALDKNKKATGDVKEAAEELAVIHEVLDQGITKEARTGDVDQAVEQTGEIEKRLTKSAEVLEGVNETLEQETTRQGKGSRKNNLIKFERCVLKRDADCKRDRADRVEVPIACSSVGRAGPSALGGD